MKRAIAELLATATIIPLDGFVLASAAEVADRFNMSGQDAIMLTSVLVHLRQIQPASACFLNRNSTDFDNPDARKELEKLNCKYFRRFDDRLNFITALIQRKS